jgi:hypothetical protein
MNFQEADRHYDALKQQYRSGNLSAEQLDRQLKELMVQDRAGNWWSKHEETGEWHYYDGNTWVQRNPPEDEYEPTTSREPPPAREQPPPVREQPPPVREQPPPVRDQPRVQPQAAEGVRAPGAAVPTYLLPVSIVVTLLCCPLTGVGAIFYSVQAGSKSRAGDTAGASQAVRNANIWLLVSLGLGVITFIFWWIPFMQGYFGAL